MGFTSDKSLGDVVASQDWDDFVTAYLLLSSNALGHSSNSTIHGGGSSTIPNWANMNDGYGITAWGNNSYKISGSGDMTISVDMSVFIESSTAISKFANSTNINKTYLDVVSSNATDSANWVTGSGSRYEEILASGVQYSNAYTWYTESSSKISIYVASGDEYSTHLTNTSNPHTVVWSDVSTAAISDLNDNYVASGVILNSISSQSVSGGVFYTTAVHPTQDRQLASKKYVDDIVVFAGGYTDSHAHDAIGAINTDTVSIDFSYDDETPSITADVKGYSIISSNAVNAQNWVINTMSGATDARFVASSTATSRFADSSQYSTDKVSWQSAYDWTNSSSNRYEEILASGVQYSNIYSSGTKYTSTYDWMVNSGSQYTNILESGTKYTNAYSWFNNSSTRISQFVGSGNEYSAAYASAQRVLDLFNHNLYVASSTALSIFANSTNINSRFFPTGLLYDDATDLYTTSRGLRIAPDSTWDMGAYKFQVSGTSYFSGTTTFIGEISGISQPNYNSGAANKYYVDNISSAIITHVDNNYYNSVGDIPSYIASSTAISKFYPSALGAGASSNVYYNTLHSSNSTIHFTKSSIDDDYIGSSQAITRFVASGVVLTSISSQNISGGTLSLHSDTLITSPASGETLMYKADNSRWENELPPMMFTTLTVRLLSGQNINLARFDIPAGENAYIWRAGAANSGGASTGDLYVEMLSGTTSVYKTSSTYAIGYPLAKSDGGATEVRFMYSSTSGYGSEENQLEFGTAFMQVSVY